MRAATGEPVRHILDWFHLSMRVRPIEQVLLVHVICYGMADTGALNGEKSADALAVHLRPSTGRQ